MRSLSIYEHRTFKDDGGIEMYEILPVVRLFDGSCWENCSHEWSINTGSIPPFIVFYDLQALTIG
jgi:hypothetical protein